LAIAKDNNIKDIVIPSNTQLAIQVVSLADTDMTIRMLERKSSSVNRKSVIKITGTILLKEAGVRTITAGNDGSDGDEDTRPGVLKRLNMQSTADIKFDTLYSPEDQEELTELVYKEYGGKLNKMKIAKLICIKGGKAEAA
jgi:hypothetical protein